MSTLLLQLESMVEEKGKAPETRQNFRDELVYPEDYPVNDVEPGGKLPAR
jgi:hypothetical protein